MGGVESNPMHHLLGRLPNHPTSTIIETKEVAQAEVGWLVLRWESLGDHESHRWHAADNDAPSGKHILCRFQPGYLGRYKDSNLVCQRDGVKLASNDNRMLGSGQRRPIYHEGTSLQPIPQLLSHHRSWNRHNKVAR